MDQARASTGGTPMLRKKTRVCGSLVGLGGGSLAWELFGLLEDEGADLVAGDVEGTESGGGGGADFGVGIGEDDFDEGADGRSVELIAGMFGGFGEGVEE